MISKSIFDFLPVAVIGLATICTPMLALTEPVEGPDAAFVFPPGWDSADVMRAAAQAEVGVVRFGALENIGIFEIAGEGDIRRLREAGAWLVLPPQALGGCPARPQRSHRPRSPIDMTSLDTLQSRAQTVTTLALLGLGVLAVITAGLLEPSRLLPAGVLSLVVAAIAIATWRLRPNTHASRSTTAAALVAFPALFVYILSGSGWQIDMHMMFFACLSVAAIMLDWRAIVTASAVTAVHHLSLNFLLPWAVFPEGSDFLRVLFHAAVVIGQSAALIWMAVQASRALEGADRKTREAEAAREAAAGSSQAAIDAKSEAEEQRRKIATLADEFEHALRQISNGMSGASEHVDTLARQLGTDAESTRIGANDAVARASTTNSDVQSVAAAAQELSASISEVARIVEDSSNISERAAAEAQGADGRSTSSRPPPAKSRRS